MSRNQSSQRKHDVEVQKIARKLERKGFEVDADIRGYDQPKTIGGYRPDLIAKKGSQRRIIEVETPDSVDSARDQAQQQAFRRAADRSESTTFKRVVTD
jgi:hypothetical protein